MQIYKRKYRYRYIGKHRYRYIYTFGIQYYAKSFRDASKCIAHQQQQTRPGQKVAPAPLGKYPRLVAVGAGRD